MIRDGKLLRCRKIWVFSTILISLMFQTSLGFSSASKLKMNPRPTKTESTQFPIAPTSSEKKILSRLASNAEHGDGHIEANMGTLFPRLMIAAPFLSFIFPLLLAVARAFPESSTEQLVAIVALFAANRLYLYVLSTTIFVLAAYRGSQDDARLGQRVVDLTEELLYNPPFDKQERDEKNSGDEFQRTALIQNLSSNLGSSLDDVTTEAQAVILPLLVAALLAVSVFFLQFFGEANLVATPNTSTVDPASLLREYLPQITKFWNILVLSLFSRCEARRLLYEMKVSWPDITSWLIGLSMTCIAYLGVWPAQNFVNMALAGLVARAIQITSFPAIVAALGLLTIYDAASVFLIKPAFAATVEMDSTTLDIALGDAATAASAMGAVAMNKLASADFQPGLLVTRVGGNIGGALGLGDAVFPAMLAIFTKRYDTLMDKKKTISLFGASLLGYIVGCLGCELLPFVTTSGVPALLLIAPSMLLLVLGVAFLRGEGQALWDFNPNPDLDKV